MPMFPGGRRRAAIEAAGPAAKVFPATQISYDHGVSTKEADRRDDRRVLRPHRQVTPLEREALVVRIRTCAGAGASSAAASISLPG